MPMRFMVAWDDTRPLGGKRWLELDQAERDRLTDALVRFSEMERQDRELLKAADERRQQEIGRCP